ncbi:MAG TPA: thioredoxin domain-containing protein [Mycobacteriales bacterium]|nr:thioredoxin domain-containing protein [Mycobacteriales bacterium]
MANRLASATSPYLLQHKDNPVDWWPWSDDAFAAAVRRELPILLSVGYAACHWCHVMAHESFEDEATAAYLNEHFVCIKVDREERPDVDAVYMEATQAMTGSGGWPMTCILTPTGEPFFCGTYFPPRDRPGMPSFRHVLEAIVEAWSTRREEIVQAGTRVVDQLAERATPPLRSGEITAEVLDAAALVLSQEHNDSTGGFGGAPQFPPSMTLEFLLRHAARTGSARSEQIVAITCERMARGGMYDQLAGGFARYSVDAEWVVPHFEKMLYDNALLARVYAHWWRLSGSPLGRRIALETCDWMIADLLTGDGGFASSLDADSDGEEGRYYVWTPDEVGLRAAEIFGVTVDGTFEHGRSVPQLRADPQDHDEYAAERARLLALRITRVPPGRDDKVVTAWNGLAIAALAETGALFGRADLVETARSCAQMLVERHLVEGRLRRVSRDGSVGDPVGVLEDYGDLAEGLLTLHQVSGERQWLDIALQLLGVATAHFADEDGRFFDTADDAQRLVRRPQDPTDGATPSGFSAVVGAMLTASALTGDADLRERAGVALGHAAALIRRFPRFAGWSAAVSEALLAGPLEIAVVAAPELAALARCATSPGAVVVTDGQSPLLVDRPPGAAYVCRGFVCDAPTTDPATLATRVGARRAAETTNGSAGL